MNLGPYPEYKDTGIESLGYVPVLWDVLPVSRYVSFGNGSDYKHVEVTAGGYPVIGSGGEFRRASEYLFDGESVLFGRKGTVDKPLYVNGKFWTVDTMYYTRIDARRVFPKFLYYWALRIPFDFYVTSTALPSMTQTDLGSAKIALPILQEQKDITDYLDRETAEIDEFIADQEELITLLEERRAATITRAITVGLNSTVPMKTNSLNYVEKIPLHWSVSRLKWGIEKIESGTSVNAQDVPVVGREVGVLKTSCVYTGNFDPLENKTVLAEDLGRVRCPVQADTLIVSRMNTPQLVAAAGYSSRGETNIYLPDRLWQVYFHSSWEPQFVHFWTKTRLYRMQVEEVCIGTSSSMQNIGQDDFRNFVLPLPPQNEQRSIVSYLREENSEIDAAIADAREAISFSKERRAAVISAAVTGKIDLRKANNNE